MSATCGLHVHRDAVLAEACAAKRHSLNRCRCCGPNKTGRYLCGHCKRHCKGGHRS